MQWRLRNAYFTKNLNTLGFKVVGLKQAKLLGLALRDNNIAIAILKFKV